VSEAKYRLCSEPPTSRPACNLLPTQPNTPASITKHQANWSRVVNYRIPRETTVVSIIPNTIRKKVTYNYKNQITNINHICSVLHKINTNEESAQMRRKHCALAVQRRSQKILPRRRPPSRDARAGQNLISWRWSLTSPTDPVW